jgi:hypothetical protein
MIEKYPEMLLDDLVRMYDIGDMIRRYCIREGRLPDIPRAEFTKPQLQILINVGREKRAVDVNYWIGQMMSAIAVERPLVALCPNLRYLNEAETIHKAGGHVVRMVRLNSNGSLFISEDRPPNDVSETELEFWSPDFTIINKEGRADLTNDFVVALFDYLWRQNQ